MNTFIKDKATFFMRASMPPCFLSFCASCITAIVGEAEIWSNLLANFMVSYLQLELGVGTMHKLGYFKQKRRWSTSVTLTWRYWISTFIPPQIIGVTWKVWQPGSSLCSSRAVERSCIRAFGLRNRRTEAPPTLRTLG